LSSCNLNADQGGCGFSVSVSLLGVTTQYSDKTR